MLSPDRSPSPDRNPESPETHPASFGEGNENPPEFPEPAHELAGSADTGQQARLEQARDALRQTTDNAPKSTEHSKEIIDPLEVEIAYHRQIEALQQAGILRELQRTQNGEHQLGILGVDGKEYAVPPIDEIQRLIQAQAEKLDPEIQAGYSRFLLVPFATDSNKLMKAYAKKALERAEAGELVDLWGEKIKPPRHHESVDRFDLKQRKEYGAPHGRSTEQIEFDRKQYAEQYILHDDIISHPDVTLSYGIGGNPNNGRVTKEEALNYDSLERTNPPAFPGWQILLLKGEQGEAEVHKLPPKGRIIRIKKACTPKNYQDNLSALEAKEGRELIGLTPESYFADALARLEEDTGNGTYQVRDTRIATILLGVDYVAEDPNYPGEQIRFVPHVGWESIKGGDSGIRSIHVGGTTSAASEALNPMTVGARFAAPVSL